VELVGIPTVAITVEPEETRQARVSRALRPAGLAVGCSLGPTAERQRRILADALGLLVEATVPGAIVERSY
jgi:hypothetical protein